MKDKGTAFVFLGVLAVMCVAVSVALIILFKNAPSGGLSIGLPSFQPSPVAPGPGTVIASTPEATATPFIPTPMALTFTVTLPATPSGASAATPAITPIGQRTPTSAPPNGLTPSATGAITPTATSERRPTPTPAFAFVPIGDAAPRPENCHSAYEIFGYTYDKAGNPLPGIPVLIYNEWGYIAPEPAFSKGGDDHGRYSIPVGLEQVRWRLTVVDENKKPISPEVMVDYHSDVACRYQVDWQRTY